MSIVLYDVKKSTATADPPSHKLNSVVLTHVSAYSILTQSYKFPFDPAFQTSNHPKLLQESKISSIDELSTNEITPDTMTSKSTQNQEPQQSKDPKGNTGRKTPTNTQASQSQNAAQGANASPLQQQPTWTTDPQIKPSGKNANGPQPNGNNSTHFAPEFGPGPASAKPHDIIGKAMNEQKPSQGDINGDKKPHSRNEPPFQAPEGHRNGKNPFAQAQKQPNKKVAIPTTEQRPVDPRMTARHNQQSNHPIRDTFMDVRPHAAVGEHFDHLEDDFDQFSDSITQDPGSDPLYEDPSYQDVLDEKRQAGPTIASRSAQVSDTNQLSYGKKQREALAQPLQRSSTFQIPGYGNIAQQQTQSKPTTNNAFASRELGKAPQDPRRLAHVGRGPTEPGHYQAFLSQDSITGGNGYFNDHLDRHGGAVPKRSAAPQTLQKTRQYQPFESTFNFTPSTDHSRVEELPEPYLEPRFKIPAQLQDHYGIIANTDREGIFEKVLQGTDGKGWQPNWSDVKKGYTAIRALMNESNEHYLQVEAALRQLIDLKDIELKRKTGLTERYAGAGAHLSDQCQSMQQATRNSQNKRRRIGGGVE
ncbi:uncharacterized protein I206_104783 [Kwoniella pini CBS 10737]|uniref:Uncharacterized protein n=1 Tax=Kwoniella pini CBS 10737 TaxID=1296096 RepID=A0A1B9I7U8_9TREE|nr:uncharacterized protein I206_02322 [Kwoniella pini CBS 10737]OCF51607.1 hypothetical protein I206_02322 [Kwoniella pini CBS 10737]